MDCSSTPSSGSQTLSQHTYRLERVRAAAAGIVEAAASSLLLLIAVKWYASGPIAKGLISAGMSFGYLATPFVISTVKRHGVPPSHAAGILALAGGGAFAVVTLFPLPAVFIAASVLALAATGAMPPLLTQVYHDNYPEGLRGRYFSRTLMVNILAGSAFGALAGHLLSKDLGYFRLVLGTCAIGLCVSSWCLFHVPSTPLVTARTGSGSTRGVFGGVIADRAVRATLISWMFLGFATLMMLPLRVEHLANPVHGWALNPDMVVLATVMLPNIARVGTAAAWGWLFDRVNFFLLRIVLNLGFAVGIVAFFTSESIVLVWLATVILGASVGGSEIAWNLWVTKVAPRDRITDYMSVHIFLTGLRGIVAPILGFSIATRWPTALLAWIAGASIVVSAIALTPEARRARQQ